MSMDNKLTMTVTWKQTKPAKNVSRVIFMQDHIPYRPDRGLLLAGLDTMTILTICYKMVKVNHDELRHRNKGGITNHDGLRHGDFELL